MKFSFLSYIWLLVWIRYFIPRLCLWFIFKWKFDLFLFSLLIWVLLVVVFLYFDCFIYSYTHWIHYFLILCHCCLLPGIFSSLWRFLLENLQKSHFHFYFLIIFLFEGLLVGLCVVCGLSLNSISFFVELYRCSHRNL